MMMTMADTGMATPHVAGGGDGGACRSGARAGASAATASFGPRGKGELVVHGRKEAGRHSDSSVVSLTRNLLCSNVEVVL
jgi:hypothetical protein